MKSLKITKSNNWYTTTEEIKGFVVTKGGSDTLRKELFNNILSENITTWKHDIHRLHDDHKEEIYKTLDEFIVNCKDHMVELFDNLYKTKEKR